MLVENGQVNVDSVVIISHKVLPRLPTGAGGRARVQGCGLGAVSTPSASVLAVISSYPQCTVRL